MTSTEFAQLIFAQRVASWPDYRPLALECVARDAFLAVDAFAKVADDRHRARQATREIPRPPPTSSTSAPPPGGTGAVRPR